MITKTIYKCERCNKTSENIDDIQQCEASHLGLTLIEYRHYEDLKFRVQAYSEIVIRENNERTRQQRTKAIEKLIEFEKEHFGG